MVLLEIKNRARAMLREVSATGSHWPESTKALQLNAWVQEGYTIVNNRTPEWPFFQQTVTLSTTYTTITADAAAGASSITVASTTGLMVGNTFHIYSGSTFEEKTITAINYGTKVVTFSVVLANAFSSGASVSVTVYALPCQVRKVEKIWQHSSTTDGEVSKYTSDDDIPMYITSSGPPTNWGIWGNFNVTAKDTDASTVHTADATTTTTVIVDSKLAPGDDNYYNGWRVTMTGPAASESSARVLEYAATAHTLILESPITGMTTGSTFLIKNDLPQLYVHPVPDAAYDLKMRLYSRPAPLVNDYDSPEWGSDGEAYHFLLAKYCAYRMAHESGMDKAAGDFLSEFNEGLKQMYVDLAIGGRTSDEFGSYRMS